MHDLFQSFRLAFGLIRDFDPELAGIVFLSLRVSLTAALIAFAAGAPLGVLLAIGEFRGKRPLLIVLNAMLGLPPVVVGLIVYILISRSGPLGVLGLLFTPGAMIIAQTILALPIVIVLTCRLVGQYWAEYRDMILTDGCSRARTVALLLEMSRQSLVSVFLAAFGRAIAEVGAILVVGGNIRGATRTMTTAIALETSKGDIALAMGLGVILVSVSVAVTAATFAFENRALPLRS